MKISHFLLLPPAGAVTPGAGPVDPAWAAHTPGARLGWPGSRRSRGIRSESRYP